MQEGRVRRSRLMRISGRVNPAVLDFLGRRTAFRLIGAKPWPSLREAWGNSMLS